MKQHIINLIYEQYKVDKLINTIGKKHTEVAGISVLDMGVDVYDVALDLMGFPPEPADDNDDSGIARDWLFRQFIYDVPFELSDDAVIKERIAKHVDWLFSELQAVKAGKNPYAELV